MGSSKTYSIDLSSFSAFRNDDLELLNISGDVCQKMICDMDGIIQHMMVFFAVFCKSHCIASPCGGLHCDPLLQKVAHDTNGGPFGMFS